MTLFLTLAAGEAFAHAHLQNAVPPVGGTVDAPPQAVTITFSEALETRFSTIEVKDASGHRVDDGKLRAEGGDGKRVSVGLKDLKPGTYTVDWHATSVDTHRTEGSYHFTIK